METNCRRGSKCNNLNDSKSRSRYNMVNAKCDFYYHYNKYQVLGTVSVYYNQKTRKYKKKPTQSCLVSDFKYARYRKLVNNFMYLPECLQFSIDCDLVIL